MYSFRRIEGWYDGRPVAAGSIPSKLISAKSSASTNTSITRTGLLSSMKSSRHSGNSVHCPRSACSTKRLIDSPIESRENHNSSSAFLHSQGQQHPQFLTAERLHMHRAIQSRPHHLRHAARIVTVGLVYLRLQHTPPACAASRHRSPASLLRQAR